MKAHHELEIGFLVTTQDVWGRDGTPVVGEKPLTLQKLPLPQSTDQKTLSSGAT